MRPLDLTLQPINYIYVYVCIYIHTYTYTYIYIYNIYNMSLCSNLTIDKNEMKL